MDMNDYHILGVSDDESVGDHPPTNYLPIGFLFFLSRGTLADADHRINILNLSGFSDRINNTKGGKKDEGGRKDHRETAKEDKSAKRDYQLGTDTEYRGMALGADIQKEVAAIAFQQQYLANAQYDEEMIKLSNLLQANQEQVKSSLIMVELYHKIGQSDKSVEKWKQLRVSLSI